jgi:tetratricopeptide (TPR) repeat protein
MLQTAQQKFPADTTISFELGAVLDKQKRFADAESAFRQVLSKDPDHAPTLNYLGYAVRRTRGERLDESVSLLQKAPRSGRTTRGRTRQPRLGVLQGRQAGSGRHQPRARRTAADQLGHPGSLRRRAVQAPRYDDAIAAWNRAIGGDGDSIDRAGIDKKIKTAKQKLGKK